MDKLMKFLKSDNGKLVSVAAGIGLVLLIIKAATPDTLNIYMNNGADCVVSSKSAKKIIKKKPKKAKKK